MNDHISHLDIGGARVTRVEEMAGPAFRLSTLFPDWDESIFEAHKDWLVPHYVNPEKMTALLNMHSWVLQMGGLTVLIDTCIGNDKNRMPAERWHQNQSPYLERLAEAGFRPDDIDVVMCTHLHVDHVGWNTQLRDGRWVPTFPNAKYVFARDEYAHWEKESAQGSERIGLTFIDSVLPVMEAGQAVLVDHDHQIEDGIWLEPTPGHSPGHVIVNVESNGERGAFIGDLMHHPIQVPHPEWSTCFCWDMEMSAASRTAFVDTHTDAGTLVLPVHFAGATAGHITRYGNAQKFTFLDDPS